MRKVLSAVAIMMVGVFALAPAASAGDAQVDDECNIYATPVVSAESPVSPGDSVAVQGSGFPAGANVVISINGTAAGSAVADASGSFSTTVTMPAGTAPGSATVTAHSDECDSTATTTTEVLGTKASTTPPVEVANAGAAKPAAQVAGSTQLATTGSNSTPLIAIAVALTGLGAFALLAARRRSDGAA